METSSDSRLLVLENQISSISTSVTKLENKVESNYATLHHRISDLRDDFQQNLENKTNRLIEKMDDQAKQSSTQHQAISDKISEIERWKWMVIGASLVVGYFIAHLKLEKLL